MFASAPAPAPASCSPRSYARAPPQRPYALQTRLQQKREPIDGDTKAFADKVVSIIEARARRARTGALFNLGEVDESRKIRSLGGSLSGSWEMERAEFIVDIPVWSPGCFQGEPRNGSTVVAALMPDLSTLHALRDTTLAHTHSLLSYLLTEHQIPASYRLLPRSATSPSSGPSGSACKHQIGWGCIRLAPSITSPVQHKRELKPAVRRTSSVIARRPSIKSPKKTKDHDDEVPHFRLDLDNAIADDDEDDEPKPVELKNGFQSGVSSDDESEDECADVTVAKEVEQRKVKEG